MVEGGGTGGTHIVFKQSQRRVDFLFFPWREEKAWDGVGD